MGHQRIFSALRHDKLVPFPKKLHESEFFKRCFHIAEGNTVVKSARPNLGWTFAALRRILVSRTGKGLCWSGRRGGVGRIHPAVSGSDRRCCPQNRPAVERGVSLA